jgi:hypothetical protein
MLASLPIALSLYAIGAVGDAPTVTDCLRRLHAQETALAEMYVDLGLSDRPCCAWVYREHRENADALGYAILRLTFAGDDPEVQR